MQELIISNIINNMAIIRTNMLVELKIYLSSCYFGGAQSKGLAMLRNVSKLQFFDKIGHAKSVGFRFYSPI